LEVKPNCCIREELTTNVIAATVPSSPRPSLHQFFCSLPELTDTNQQLYSWSLQPDVKISCSYTNQRNLIHPCSWYRVLK
jgi:hypothetical protein